MDIHPDTALIPTVLRALATLLVWLGAPVRTWRRYVGYTDEQRFLLERTLIALQKRGVWLRYDGESDATVEKRLRMIECFIHNPRKAMRHLARIQRRYGARPWRALDACAPDAAPLTLVFASLVHADTVARDSS